MHAEELSPWPLRRRYRVDAGGVWELTRDGVPREFIDWLNLRETGPTLRSAAGARIAVHLGQPRRQAFLKLVRSHWRQVCPEAWAADERRRHRQLRRLVLLWVPLTLAVLLGLSYSVYGARVYLGTPPKAEALTKLHCLTVLNAAMVVLLYVFYFGWARRSFQVPAQDAGPLPTGAVTKR